jgi:RecA-family ATPase
MKKSKEKAQKKAVVQPTRDIVERKRRLAELNKLRISTKTEVAPEQPFFSVDGIPIIERKDIVAVKAKPKEGKTTMLKVLVGALLKGKLFRLKSEMKEPKVLWVDTEQKEQDVKLILDDIKQLTDVDDNYIDTHLKLYNGRRLSFQTLLEDTKLLISSYQPDLVIADGLVDYIESFNDEAKSKTLINELVQISDQYNCVIINVLHENKGSDNRNMRGHLGTMLAQKASLVLECKKDGNNVITVSSSESRHQSMPEWKIKYDEYGHIVCADSNQLTQHQQEERRRNDIVKKLIQDKGGAIKRKELTSLLEIELGKARPTISNLITKLLNQTLYEENDLIKVRPDLFDELI